MATLMLAANATHPGKTKNPIQRCFAMESRNLRALQVGSRPQNFNPAYAVDQRRPVELGLAHADMVDVGLLDLVQGVAGGHQDFFRRAAPIWAGAPKVALFDHRHLHPCLSGWYGDAEAGIAAAQDLHIVAIGCHELAYPGAAALSNAQAVAIDAAKGEAKRCAN
jgi:hypothetical protein